MTRRLSVHMGSAQPAALPRQFSFSAASLKDREHARSSLVLYRRWNAGVPRVEHRDAYLNEIEYFVSAEEGRDLSGSRLAEKQERAWMVHTRSGDSLESWAVVAQM